MASAPRNGVPWDYALVALGWSSPGIDASAEGPCACRTSLPRTPTAYKATVNLARPNGKRPGNNWHGLAAHREDDQALPLRPASRARRRQQANRHWKHGAL